MISKKELEYVGRWPRKVPHPGKAYANDTLKKLADTKQLYDENYKGRKYSICFSNKNEIELEILNKNLAHMLGVGYKELISDFHNQFRSEVLGMGADEKISSYDLLGKIIENHQLILEYEEEIKRCILNYYQINIKCGIFEKISDLSNFNYGCIELDHEKFRRVNGKNFCANSEKILYTPSGEVNTPYFMMGIIQSDPLYNNDYMSDDLEQESLVPPYVVETLFAPNDPELFFRQQEVTIPTQLFYADKGHFIKKEASATEKLELLRTYREAILKYNLDDNLNISGDYELILNDLSKKENKGLVLK